MTTPPSSDALPESPAVPAGKKDLTPEERLFQVIESGGEPVRSTNRLTERWPWLKNLSLPKWNGRLRILQWNLSLPKWNGRLRMPQWDLSLVNWILGVCVGLALIGTVIDVFLVQPDLARIYDRVAKANTASADQPSSADLRKPLEDYLMSITSRNLFERGETATEEAVGSEIPKSSADVVLDNLELVGIAWGEVPEGMIRTKDNGRTHFVQKGKKLGEVVIEDIFKDRVVVKFGGHARELR